MRTPACFIIFSLAPPTGGCAPSDRTAAYLRMPRASRRTRPAGSTQPCGPAPRDETFLSSAHHYSTDAAAKTAEMTDKHFSVRALPLATLYEYSTANKIFCTKTAHRVYAESVGDPPITHSRGEPVTFFVVAQLSSACNTLERMASSANKTRLNPRFYEVFTGTSVPIEKNGNRIQV